MIFHTPQEDIDRMLAVEQSVTPEEGDLFMECMNGRTLSERIKSPVESEQGRDVRDGCILVGVFMRCRPKATERKAVTL